MAFKVPFGTSAEGFPAIVTVPGLTGVCIACDCPSFAKDSIRPALAFSVVPLPSFTTPQFLLFWIAV